jgi:hypothetical protein
MLQNEMTGNERAPMGSYQAFPDFAERCSEAALAAAMIARKEAAVKLAPPTRTPSTSSLSKIDAALAAVTEPP